MKYKVLLAAMPLITIMGSAPSYADTKVAEYGDPVIGNSYHNCTFDPVYSTGGGNFLYTEYEINCPSYGTYEVGVTANITYTPYYTETCSFQTGDPSYYVNGNCDNWRVYLSN